MAKKTEKEEEPYKPMAVQEPDPLERLEALELRMSALERWKDNANTFCMRVARDHSYHFGGQT